MKQKQVTQADMEAANQAYQKRSKDDFLLFVQGLIIPSAVGPRLFRSCQASFQKECFESMAPSLHAVRDGIMPPKRRFWIERTKKAGKDSDLAACLLWLIAFPKRPFYAQVGAADRDQAAIVKRRINDLLYHNEWLNEHVTIQSYKVKHNGGLAELDILAADIAGSHGETPHVLVVNELSHIVKWEFIENLLDNADGVPQGLIMVATNAGFHGTKAETMRKTAIRSKAWSTHIWDRPAPWIGKIDLEDAKTRNSRSRYSRLWWGRWVSGKGDAIDESDIERCFKLKGPTAGPEPGWQYIAGLDLGVSHDHCGLAVVGVNSKEQRLKLVYMKGWAPGKNGEVDLIAVEDACLSISRHWRISWFGYDPTQAKLMAQRLFRKNVPMREVSFSVPKNLTAMATCFLQVIEAGKFECYDDEDGRLRRDFGKFNIAEKPYGYKLEAVSDEYGHADVGTAVIILMPKAVQLLAGIGREPSDPVAEEEETDLTEDEVESMPAELREIYESVDDVSEGEIERVITYGDHGIKHVWSRRGQR